MWRSRNLVIGSLAGLGLILALFSGPRRHGVSADQRKGDGKSSGTQPPGQVVSGDVGRGKRNSNATPDSVRLASERDMLSPERVTDIQSILDETDLAQMDRKIGKLSADVTEEELPLAVAALVRGSPEGRDLGLRLIRAWTDDNEFLVGQWIGQVTRALMDRNVAGASELIRQIQDASDRLAALPAKAQELAESQPDEAIRLAFDMPTGETRDNLLTHLARSWAGQDPKAAVEWAGKLGDESFRETILSSIAVTLGGKDPRAAATLAVTSLRPGRLQEDAFVGIVQQWVQTEPANAAAWVAKFPEGTLRDTAMESVVRLWLDRDPVAAAKWVSALSDGEGRDVAIGAYAMKAMTAQPEAAALWVERITDESKRVEKMQIVGAEWLSKDYQAAKNWISQANLSEEIKARLLSRKRY